MEPATIPTNVSESPESYQRAMLKAWEKFTANQQMDPMVPPLIAASWRRSWVRVNPNNPIGFTHMSSDHLLASQTASFDLMAIARPVIEDVYQCVQNSGTAIILTNNVGCILDIVGDEEIIKIMEEWGAGRGSILAEEQIGTTSIALALTSSSLLFSHPRPSRRRFAHYAPTTRSLMDERMCKPARHCLTRLNAPMLPVMAARWT